MDDLFSVSTVETKENFNNNSFDDKKKKDNKKLIRNIIISVLALLLICGGVFSYLYIKEQNIPAKEYIIKIFKEEELFKEFKVENLKQLTDNLNNKSFEIKADGNIDPKFLKNKKDTKKDVVMKSENKLEIKDLDFIFTGAVNNSDDSKSNVINTTLLWDKKPITSWKVFENSDIVLLEAPDYFQEMIAINKENIDLMIKNDKDLAKIYKNVLFSQDENVFEEILMLKDVMKKSYLNSLEKIVEANFKVDPHILTEYNNKKIYADNYELIIDKITLDMIFTNLISEVETSLQVDGTRYKSFSKNKESLISLINKFKPVINGMQKLKMTLYKIDNKVKKIDISMIEPGKTDMKIFQMEFNLDEKKNNNKKEVIAIIGNTKIKLDIVKDREQYVYEINFETFKSNFQNIIQKNIKVNSIEDNKKNKENEEEKTVSNLNKDRIKIDGKQIEFLAEQIIEENTNNNTNEIQSTIGIDNIINAKEEEKIILKIVGSVPENINASNIKMHLNIYSNILDLSLNSELKFSDMIIIDILEGQRVFIDTLTESERKNLYKNIIEPTIIGVTAKKIDEIIKIKKYIETDSNIKSNINENVVN